MTLTFVIYFFILSSTAFFAYILTRTKDHELEFPLRILIFLVLFIPAALRYGIAADYLTYESFYYGNYEEYFEIGFSLLTDFLHFFNANSIIFFSVVSFFTYISLVFIIRKADMFLMILFYVLFSGYFNSFGQIRQSLALPFLLLSLYYIRENKSIKSLLLILFATLFHASSIIFIPFVFLRKVQLKNEFFFFVALSLIWIAMIIPLDLLFSCASFVSAKYQNYESRLIEPQTFSGLGPVVILFYPCVFLFLMRKKDGVTISQVLILSYILGCLLTVRHDIFNRIRDVLQVGVMYSFVDFKYINFKNLFYVSYLLIGLAFFIRTIIANVGPGTAQYSPYVSWLF